MNDTLRISLRCTRIAQMVDAPVRDQTILLRAARMLKGLHGDLTRAAWQQARLAGRTPSGVAAAEALTSAEQHLRRALLEYASLPPAELRDLVARALAEIRRIVVVLEGDPLTPQPQTQPTEGLGYRAAGARGSYGAVGAKGSRSAVSIAAS